MRKRKRVDSTQHGAINGGSLAVDGNVLNEPYQDLLRPNVDTPLPSFMLASSPSVDLPPPWVPPVTTTGGYSLQDQALVPARASRLTSGSGPTRRNSVLSGMCGQRYIISLYDER